MNAGAVFINLAHQFEYMNIAGYISNLLYYNDCVIIPDFGGFVTNYAPAKIHPTNHTFFPPSKSILFNSKLTNDDGILMHYVALEENIPYAEAKLEIGYFVQELKFLLEEGRDVVLDKIGILSQNSNEAFSFSPDKTVNYLDASYGLSSFISPPIVRKSMHKRLEKKFIDRKAVPDSERKDRKVYWAYATIIPIILIVGWFVFMNGYNNKNVQQTGVLTISESDIEKSEEVSIANSGHENASQALKDLNFSDTAQPPGQEHISGSGNSKVSMQKVTVQQNYYIIGGAFQYKPNADKLIASLHNSGYNATHAGLNPKGLYLVSYFNSEDKSEALANLAMIRRDSNPSAWLLKK